MCLTQLRRHEEGSVLALVPAGFLVLMVLAAVAVDSAVALLGQRQLQDLTAAAANDAAGAALADAGFYQSGAVQIDPAEAARVVCAVVAAQAGGGVRDLQVSLGTSGPVVTVAAAGRVEPVFGGHIPGAAHRVSARATAVAATGRSTSGTEVPVSLNRVDCTQLS